MIILRLTTLILYKTKAMNRFILLMAVVFTASAAIAQTASEPSPKPEEEIIINKEYDEDGNLVRYDSTRTYRFYSDPSIESLNLGELEELFGESSPLMQLFQGMFANDSLFAGMPGFEGFPDTAMVKNFSFKLDSTFTRNFPFRMDSAMFIGPDSSFMLPPGFIMPNMQGLEELMKQFGDEFGSDDPFSDFLKRRDPADYERFFDPEHRQEWEELIERHQREMEEMYRQWDQNAPKKEY